ncbi:hypothetical protein KI387_040668 [Taxus chinensis]|uniref:Uncharacterized protein n=1 Tax=Taxus chinensis TaxID=29808 RepID=A0AA38C365_TAXCH|nr:hypothetical protein KI387_040668 [Taxus chinensis]
MWNIGAMLGGYLCLRHQGHVGKSDFPFHDSINMKELERIWWKGNTLTLMCGTHAYHPFRVKGLLHNQGVTMLVENGTIILCITRKIVQLSILLGVHEVCDDFFVIELANDEIVLGVQWLQTLGEFTLKYHDKELKFCDQVGEIRIHGMRKEVNAEANLWESHCGLLSCITTDWKNIITAGYVKNQLANDIMEGVCKKEHRTTVLGQQVRHLQSENSPQRGLLTLGKNGYYYKVNSEEHIGVKNTTFSHRYRVGLSQVQADYGKKILDDLMKNKVKASTDFYDSCILCIRKLMRRHMKFIVPSSTIVKDELLQKGHISKVQQLGEFHFGPLFHISAHWENSDGRIVTITGAARCLIWEVGKLCEFFIFNDIQVDSIIEVSEWLFLGIVGAYSVNVGVFPTPMSWVVWKFLEIGHDYSCCTFFHSLFTTFPTTLLLMRRQKKEPPIIRLKKFHTTTNIGIFVADLRGFPATYILIFERKMQGYNCFWDNITEVLGIHHLNGNYEMVASQGRDLAIISAKHEWMKKGTHFSFNEFASCAGTSKKEPHRFIWDPGACILLEGKQIWEGRIVMSPFLN